MSNGYEALLSQNGGSVPGSLTSTFKGEAGGKVGGSTDRGDSANKAGQTSSVDQLSGAKYLKARS